MLALVIKVLIVVLITIVLIIVIKLKPNKKISQKSLRKKKKRIDYLIIHFMVGYVFIAGKMVIGGNIVKY